MLTDAVAPRRGLHLLSRRWLGCVCCLTHAACAVCCPAASEEEDWKSGHNDCTAVELAQVRCRAAAGAVLCCLGRGRDWRTRGTAGPRSALRTSALPSATAMGCLLAQPPTCRSHADVAAVVLCCAVLQVLYWLMVVGYQLRMLEVRLDMRTQFESDSDDGSSGPFRTSLPPGRW